MKPPKAPMALAIPITCDPVRDAVVSLWHCDAEGVYSGFESSSTGGASGNAEDPAGGGGRAPGGAPPAAEGGSGGADSEATPTDGERYCEASRLPTPTA